MYVTITCSTTYEKKMLAIFYDSDTKQLKTVHFGATGYLDYTIAPHDEERRKRYIKRHKDEEIGTII